MGEALPILSGAVLGVLMTTWRPSRWLVAALMMAAAVMATVASGEFRAGWSFVLVDGGLVAGSAAAAFGIIRALRARPAVQHAP